MNAQNNIEVIRNTYAAFAAGDAQAILANIAEGTDWINYGSPKVPYTGSRSGKSEIMGFFQAIAETTTGGTVVADQYLADGETVVALGRYRATVRETGAQIDTPVVHVFTVRDGKIVRWEGFSDSDKVAEAHTVKATAAR